MPSLNDILLQTMPLTASPGSVNNFSGPKSIADIVTDPPNPKATTTVIREPNGKVTTPAQPLRRRINVWSWKHSGSDPASVKDVRSFVLGMFMDYSHPMVVCEEIRVEEVSITFTDGTSFSHLPLTPDFILRKYQFLGDPNQLGRGIGHTPSPAGFWLPDTDIDQSFMVVFAYQFNQSGPPDPVDDQETTKPDFMPAPVPKGTGFPCNVGEVLVCKRETPRIVVCFSLTCCMEKNDFEPGGVLGANRIFPHVMLMSNVDLQSARAVIKVVRPPQSSHAGAEMQPDISPILFADTNIARGATAGPPLPEWDNFFDYFESDPIGHGFQNKVLTLVDGDPASPRAKDRTFAKRLLKLDPPSAILGPTLSNFTYADVDLKKEARQGDFDNLHLAPKMAIGAGLPAFADPTLRGLNQLDNITMAPFCVHDCLHTHVRWGAPAVSFLNQWATFFGFVAPLPDTAKGFNDKFQPFSVEGAPQVPHNQSVQLTLLGPAAFTYAGMANFDVLAGRWQIFFHHGMAYANEIWDFDTVFAARTAVEVAATNRSERSFVPLFAFSSFAVFYWRLRFGGKFDKSNLFVKPMERLVADPKVCAPL